MTRFRVFLFIIVILKINAFNQITESRFHYEKSMDTIGIEIRNYLFAKPYEEGKSCVTRAEKNYFLRIFLSSEVYENLESIEVDSNRISAKISGLENDTNFYFDQLIKLNKDRLAYNSLATYSNLTNDTIYIPSRFYTLYGIIEAIDTNGKWKPIQYCYNHGEGDHSEEVWLAPNQSLLIPFSNNFGSRTTQMRLKLHGNDTIYTSNTFEGQIDDDDFIIPTSLIDRYDETSLFLNIPIFKNMPWATEFEFTIFKE